MKAPNFDYVRARSVQQAIDELVARGDSAQILAGGQSLMAMLNLRLTAPSCLIDIGGVAGLRDIEQAGGAIRIGAMVTHAQLQQSELIAQKVPLLAQTVPHVAHLAIRNSGTIG
ncbi:MAG: FAD binding domain-containing protein, partial [Quisquiliibacterium sp.]